MQQLPHIVLPNLGYSQGLVATGFRPDRKRYGVATFDSALESTQPVRVEFVIGKIEGQQARLDLAQPGRRIIIARCIELPNNVVRLLHFHFQRVFGNVLDVFVGIVGPSECFYPDG
jgi:hypothetical protein